MSDFDESADFVSTASRSDPKPGPWETLREEGTPLDLLILIAVPAVLLAIYMLPRDVKLQLAFEYTDPSIATAYTSHFVHLSFMHLLVNLVGGAVIVPTGYLLSVLSGRHRRFVVTFICFLVAFPFVLSGLNLIFVRPAIGVGFSGVLLAFVGYLGIAVMEFVGEWYGAPVDGTESAWLFFLGFALLTYDISPYGLPLALAALLASLLFLLDITESLDRDRLRQLWTTATSEPGGELVLLGLVVFLLYPAVSIPSDPSTATTGVVNLYSHVLGFCLGYIVTYLTVLIGFH